MRPLTVAILSILMLSAIAWAENKIGVILPMTGDFARYGMQVRRGIETASDTGTELLFEDEGCRSTTAISAFQKLSAVDGVRLFIGPMCGSPQIALAPLIARSGVLAVLGSSAPQRVFELSHGRMLSVQHSIEQESSFNAQEMFRLGARRVVVLISESEFSRAHEEAFRANFHGEVLGTLAYSGDSAELRTLTIRLSRLAPDALYVPDAAALLHGLTRELEALGPKRPRIFSVYAMESEDVLQAMGDQGEGIIFSYPDIEGDALEYFPRLATQVLNAGLLECMGGEPSCLLKAIQSKYRFDKNGVLEGALRLKTIRHHAFVWYKDGEQDREK